LIDRLRHCYQDDSEQDVADLMAWYASMDTLLIDDAGAERMTPFGVEKLTELVDARLREERRMIITTNHNRAELLDRVGPRLTSRMLQGNAELGEMLVVPVTAADYRR
jgi:DNA replication protein DnaC